MRWGARALVRLGEEFPSTLGTDPAVAHYCEILGRLVPFSHDSTGYMLDPTHRFLLPHRHWSHIIMIYDLELAEGRFNHSAGADNSLLTTSLDHWSGLTCNDTLTCPNSCRGFSRGATAVMSALLNRPEAARGNLTRLLDQVLTPNGMYGEGVTSNAYGTERYQISPCPESAYIGSAALHEQLVHSDVVTASDGKRCATVRVFPASAWDEAEFHKLRALGGLLVSARKKAGQPTEFVRVEALQPGPVGGGGGGGTLAGSPAATKCVTLMVAGWADGVLPVATPPSVVVKSSPVEPGAMIFELPIGGHVVLSRGAPTLQGGNFSIGALPSNAAEFHWLGYNRPVTNMAMQCSGDWPSEAAGSACAANYNSTKPCCGQDPHEKVPVPLIDRCPAGSPTCCGYVYGQHLGVCGSAPCPPGPPPPPPPPPPSPPCPSSGKPVDVEWLSCRAAQIIKGCQEGILPTSPLNKGGCPKAFPYAIPGHNQGTDFMPPEDIICYNDSKYVSLGGGPCGSWCTHNLSVGTGCGDNHKHMCPPSGINATSAYTPDATHTYGAQWTRDFQYTVSGASELMDELSVKASVRYVTPLCLESPPCCHHDANDNNDA